MELIKELKEKLEEKITGCDEVFITPHNDPDFDAIGSAIGVSEICGKFKEPNYIILANSPFSLQPGVKKIYDETHERYKYISIDEFEKRQNNSSKKLLITVDVNKTYLISLGKSLEYFKDIIIIDHHNPDKNTINTPYTFIETLVSSTCEIIANLLKSYNIKINSNTAAYLLTGIMLDTCRYTRNASFQTFQTVAKLTKIMCQCLPLGYANSLFMDDFESDRIVQDLVKCAAFHTITYAIAVNRENLEKIYTKEDLAKAADYLLRYNINTSFALGFIDSNTISISARSSGDDGIDVGTIMQQFGGGGNAMSAAAKINSTDIGEVERNLQKILRPCR